VADSVELGVGTIGYIDTGGDGPVLVFLHGLLMDASLWDALIADLAPRYRCVAPTLPPGAHAQPMGPDADLSLPGYRPAHRRATRSSRHGQGHSCRQRHRRSACPAADGRGSLPRRGVVLVSCDAFDNFPPGLTGKVLVATGKLPPSPFGLFMQQMRLRFVRRLPMAFGWLTKQGDTATARWIRPVLQRSEIRTDTVRLFRAIAADRHLLLETAERLESYDGPALIVWANEDRVMPPEHGRRLAGQRRDERADRGGVTAAQPAASAGERDELPGHRPVGPHRRCSAAGCAKVRLKPGGRRGARRVHLAHRPV